jgi:hypothetical protein
MVDKHRDAKGVPNWDDDTEFHKRRQISVCNSENSANFAMLRLHGIRMKAILYV